MATISQLGLPQDQLQALMAQVMQNPVLIKEAVEELGLDFQSSRSQSEATAVIEFSINKSRQSQMVLAAFYIR